MDTTTADTDESLARIGEYFLKRDRNKAGTIGICTVKKVTSKSGKTSNQTVRVAATDTSDPAVAEIALHRFVLNSKEAQDKARLQAQAKGSQAVDLRVLDAVNKYYLGHAEKKGGEVAKAVLRVMGIIQTAWPENPLCSTLNRKMQRTFVEYCRAQGWADTTTSQRLQYVFAAMHWCNAEGYLLPNYPRHIQDEEWECDSESSVKAYTIEELAALFRVAGRTDADGRRRNEHRWRYMVNAVGTIGRPTAVRKLTWRQFDQKHRLMNLNPEGRRQNKKRRASAKMGDIYFAEVMSWSRDGEYIATWNDEPLQSMSWFYDMAEEAGVGGSPMSIRKGVRTYLDEIGVPDKDADVAMAHAEDGSDTGRRHYKQRRTVRPGYLAPVATGINRLLSEIEQLSGIPFRGERALVLVAANDPVFADPKAPVPCVEQPTPDDAHSLKLYAQRAIATWMRDNHVASAECTFVGKQSLDAHPEVLE